jgi:hypothetical protein
VRSSSSRSRDAALLALILAIVIVGGGGVSAHRVDEYLQATRIAIDPDRVHLELDLTPGIALAETILAAIDRDGDGSLSSDEQRAYGRAVLNALALDIDGTPIRAELDSARFPGPDEIRRGEGTVRLELAAPLPRLSGGVHHLFFRNGHHSDRSVYLANALVPASDRVSVTAQRRDGNQTELTIDYVLRAAPPRPPAAWLLVGLVVATALSAFAIRPLRSPRRH